MKRRFMLCALAAAGLAAASGVGAQVSPPYGRDPRRDDRYGPNGEGRADPWPRAGNDPRRGGDPRYPRDRHDDRYGPNGEGRHDARPYPRGNAYGHDRHYRRGVGPGYAYYPGHRLPPVYRGHQYVVDDWRGHRLSAPPRGYQWVQIGADYALVAVATGVILQVLLAN